MSINFFRLDPIRRFAFFLIVFAATALGYNLYIQPEAAVLLFIHLACTLGFGLILFALYSRLSSKHKNIWDTVITCLILFLVLHYEAVHEFIPGFRFSDIAYPLIATFFALTLKFFVEFRASPVVNPTAGSLLLMAAAAAFIPGLEKPFISWWGASFWILPFEVPVSLFLIAIWILGGLHVWKKWPILISFLAAHALFLFLRTSSLETLSFTFLDSTIYFLAGVMLVEPKTSPLLAWKQVAYGVLAAVILNAFAYWNLPHYELFAIVGANLFNAGLKWKPAPKPAMQV